MRSTSTTVYTTVMVKLSTQFRSTEFECLRGHWSKRQHVPTSTGTPYQWSLRIGRTPRDTCRTTLDKSRKELDCAFSRLDSETKRIQLSIHTSQASLICATDVGFCHRHLPAGGAGHDEAIGQSMMHNEQRTGGCGYQKLYIKSTLPPALAHASCFHPHSLPPVLTRSLLRPTAKMYNCYTPAETTEIVSRAGAAKANTRLDKIFTSAVMAGMLLAFACATLLSTSASPWYQSEAPGLIRTIAALVFPYGLCMIVLTGSDLCTGSFLVRSYRL